MRLNRLLWRLFFPYLVAAMVGVAAFGLFESNVFRQFYHDRFADSLANHAAVCARDFSELLAPDRLEALRKRCKRMAEWMGARLTVCLPTGEVLADSAEDPKRMENHVDRPEIHAALEGETGRSVRFSNTLGEDLMYVALPIRQGETIAGAVRVSLPMPVLRQGLRDVWLRLATGGLLAVAVIAGVSYWLSRRLAGTLRNMTDGASRFARGDLKHRLAMPDVEELAALADSLNRMAGQLDERLREIMRQRNELRAVLANMVEGVLAVSNDGRILSVNLACAALLESEPESLRGKLIHEMIRQPDLLAFVEEALAGGGELQRDLALRGPEDRWLQTYATPLVDADDRTFGLLLVFHDITRLRHLENVRRDFVANVSHELRTPLTSIKGFLETLADGAIDDRENAMRFLQIALRQIDRLSAVIDDLLALSRLERTGEEQSVELTLDSLAGVLQVAMETCSKLAADKNIRVVCQCPDDLVLPMNALQLERAVVNLLDNAIKYSGAGSQVVVRAQREGNEVVIRVEDQGSGIAPQHLPRIFERFYRVDKARSRELGGTGLGLSIVKHAAAVHHGTVGVESTLGKGSVFWIRLPCGE